MVTRHDYNKEMVKAAHSVLLELAHVLGEYREGIAIVGGWVPGLLIPEDVADHVGSMDVDLALDHKLLQEAGYETIRQRLESHGYRQDQNQPFIFYRDVPSGDNTITIEVDLLAGEYEGTGSRHRTQRIQDANARKARGCDLVFPMSEEISISGVRPGGYKDTATIKIAGIVPFIVMKGMALVDREKEKDAYDIYFILKNYPSGLDKLIELFQPHCENRLVREGLQNIAERFATPGHIGPNFVADFEEIIDIEERTMLTRDVYERTNYFLRGLNVIE